MDMPSDSDLSLESNFKKKIMSGFKWLAFGKFVGQFINWTLSFFVIRLLEPADYGLMAMASIFVTIFALFNEMGMGAALIQAKEISINFVRQIFGITLIINFSLFVILFLASPLIGDFFSEPQLAPIVRVLSVQFVLMAFIIIPQSLLDRRLDFKNKSIIDLLANLIAGSCSLVLALTHHGVWSLVWASVILICLRTIGYNIIAPFRNFPVFSLKGMKDVVLFGSQITLERIAWYVYSQADTLIIGKILGKDALGYYSIGKHVSSLPADKIMPIINQIVFPAFSRIQKDIKKIGFYTIMGIELIGFVAFPVFLGISCISFDLISVFLGEKWIPAVFPLLTVSLIFPLRMINSFLVSVLKSLRKTGLSFINQLIYLGLMTPAFYFSTAHGIKGVSLVWLIVFPICFLIVIYRLATTVGLRSQKIFAVMLKSLIFSLIMYAILMLIKQTVLFQSPSLITLFSLVFIGITIYTGLHTAFNRTHILSMIKLIKH